MDGRGVQPDIHTRTILRPNSQTYFFDEDDLPCELRYREISIIL
jgi:hypothetical protein